MFPGERVRDDRGELPLTMPSWFVMAGAIAVFAGMAVMVIRDRRGTSQRAAERQLASDIEAWLRDRETAA